MKRLLLTVMCVCLALSAVYAEGAPRTERLPDEVLMTYYDRSVFAGDSLVLGFRGYVRSEQQQDPAFFAGITFFGVASYQLRAAAVENVNGVGTQLKYKGRDTTLAHIMEKEQPRRVFIFAGLNDRIHAFIDRADDYVNRIMALRDKFAPETEICFFTLTPVGKKVGAKRQKLHDEYNAWLAQKCAEVGAVCIDIASPLKGEDGMLPNEISSDKEYHLNAKGNAVWARTLLDFAQSRYEAGLWTPEDAAAR